MPLEKLAIFILVVVTTTTSASRPGTTDDAEKLAKDEEERLAKMVEWSKTTTPPSDIVAPLLGGPISCTAACMDICMVLEPPSEHVYELACEFGCAQSLKLALHKTDIAYIKVYSNSSDQDDVHVTVAGNGDGAVHGDYEKRLLL
ncbi:hypothetical protein Tco_1287409 [Tanacetum coccineum]